jgi:hypothetical protein
MKRKIERSPAFYIRRRQYGLYPLILLGFIVFLFVALGGGGSSKADTKSSEEGSNYITTLPQSKAIPITDSKSTALTEQKTLEEKNQAVKKAQASMDDNFDFGSLDKKSVENDKPKSKSQRNTHEEKNLIGDSLKIFTDGLGSTVRKPKSGRKTLIITQSSPLEKNIPKETKAQNTPTEIKPPLRTGFYGTQSSPTPENSQTATNPKNVSLRAMIHGSQTITQGDMVKLRLLDGITLSGQFIPANTFIFGQSSFTGNRVTLTVHSIRIGGKLIPIELKAYDLDGASGIAAPDLEDNNLGNEALNEVPSAASTGIGIIDRTASALVRKKTKKQITLPSEYNLILRHGEE